MAFRTSFRFILTHDHEIGMARLLAQMFGDAAITRSAWRASSLRCSATPPESVFQRDSAEWTAASFRYSSSDAFAS